MNDELVAQYGVAAPHVRVLQEAVDRLNRCLVMIAYAMGDDAEVTVVQQDGSLTGPVSQVVVTPRWFRPRREAEEEREKK